MCEIRPSAARSANDSTDSSTFNAANDLEGSALGVLLGSGVAIASALGIRVATARCLPAEALGALLLAMAVASFLGMVASLGLRQASARRIAGLLALGDSVGARSTARTALAVAFVSGLAAALFVAFGLRLVPPHLAGGIGAIPFLVRLGTAPAALGLALGVAMWGISQGYGDTRGRALFRDAGGSLLRLAGVGLVVLVSTSFGVGPAHFAIGWGMGSFLGEVSFVAYGARQGWIHKPPRDSASTRGRDSTLLRSLPPFFGTTLVNQLATWLDVVLLGLLAPLPVVGVYGAAQGLGRVLGQLNDSASHRFLGLAAAAVTAGDEAKLTTSYLDARRLSLSYLWPALAPCLLAPEALSRVLFGAPYEAAGVALRWLALGWLLRSFAGYTEEALIARGRASAVFGLVLLSSLTLVMFFVLWIPSAGAVANETAEMTKTAEKAAIAVWIAQALRVSGGLALLGRSFGATVFAPRALTKLALPLLPAIAAALVMRGLAVSSVVEVVAVVLAALPAALPAGVAVLRRRQPQRA